MPNLKQLDKKELTEIIQGFGADGKIFQSEAQFQFEFAWTLQKMFPDCQVKLEDMRTVIKEKDKKDKNGNEIIKKKFYTDIVLEQGEYSIAIELKYKTAEYSDTKNNLYLFNHGAVDLGRYDYLWDVHRLELLLEKGNKSELCGDVEVLPNKGCDKGFAVLLTNEKKYWGQSYVYEKENGYTIDNQFKIGEKDEGKTHKLFGNVLDWRILEKGEKNYAKNYKHYPSTVVTQNGNSTERAQPIRLAEQYSYKWEDYLCNELQFKFVIIEVNK